MKNSENIHFEKYKVLLNEIDQHTAFLEDMHHEYLKCRNGCALCCIDFSVLPIEFYFILNELRNENLKFSLEGNLMNDVCAFLKNNLCSKRCKNGK